MLPFSQKGHYFGVFSASSICKESHAFGAATEKFILCFLGIDLKCKSKTRAVEGVQQVKAFASKPDSLGYILRFHTVGEDKPG